MQPAIEFPPVAAPTMGVWGSEDFALSEAQMVGSAERSCRARGATSGSRALDHWVMLEDPDRVNALLLDFLPTP